MAAIFRIKIIAVGKIRETYLEEGIFLYRQRLSPWARLEILEVRNRPSRAREAEGIRAHLAPGDHVIVLDRQGKPFSSESLARYLGRLAAGGQSGAAFIIGGSQGLDPLLLKEADLVLSFSPLTFPHQLFRLMLMEQLYRAFSIIKGHPYHK